jgi:hypothetical protein
MKRGWIEATLVTILLFSALATLNPCANAVESTATPKIMGQSIPSILSCDALSSNPRTRPAYSSKFSFSFVNGSLTGERVTTLYPGKEVYIGTLDQSGAINISGQGEYYNRGTEWHLTFSGQLNNSGETVLMGTMLSLRDGGTRQCSISFLDNSDELRVKFALEKAEAKTEAVEEAAQRKVAEATKRAAEENAQRKIAEAETATPAVEEQKRIAVAEAAKRAVEDSANKKVAETEAATRAADDLAKRASELKEQKSSKDAQSATQFSIPSWSSSTPPPVGKFTNQAPAEVAGCNDDRVKQVLINNTFVKMKVHALEYWQKQLSEPFIQQTAPYTCPPFHDPSPRPGEYRPQYNAPLNPRSSAEYLEAHNRACAAQAAMVQEQARRNEAQFNERHNTISRNIDLVTNSVSATITNIRQQKYDETNRARYCEADFEYQNITTELRYALGSTSEGFFGPVGDPTCRKEVAYKIELLLDKPDDLYVSWRCL